MELEENQAKRYQWEQDQIAHMKNYIARFGHGSAKLARQAQSKEKTLAKMVAGGLTEKVEGERNRSFAFYSCGEELFLETEIDDRRPQLRSVTGLSCVSCSNFICCQSKFTLIHILSNSLRTWNSSSWGSKQNARIRVPH